MTGNNCFSENFRGNYPFTTSGNIDADPLFVDAANGDLYLQVGSPAVDSGDQTLLPACITTDLNGNLRVVGANVDLGAREFQGTTSNTARPAFTMSA